MPEMPGLKPAGWLALVDVNMLDWDYLQKNRWSLKLVSSSM
jgi:hypothetical protein